VLLGDPYEVADRYLEINFGRDRATSRTDDRSGDGEARVIEAWVENEAGERLTSVPQGSRVRLRARVAFMVDVEDPQSSVYIHNSEHQAVIVVSSTVSNERTGHFRAGDEAVFSFSFENVLAPGRYNPVFNLAHHGFGLDTIDRFEGAFSFVVTGSEALGGLVDVPVEFGISRSDSPLAQGTSA
jgi:hypothetical protein